jgi:hypothetical protein
MKFVLLLLLPVLGYYQDKLIKITLFENKVELMVPEMLGEMSADMWNLKYQQQARPALVLTDGDAEINLIADMTQQSCPENKLIDYKDFRIEHLKKQRPDVEMLADGVKTINGKKVAWFKFLSQAVDQKVFNYYSFIIIDGKILSLTFNCIKKIQKPWERKADEIIASLKTN